jgi:hypothetical protein
MLYHERATKTKATPRATFMADPEHNSFTDLLAAVVTGGGII